MGIEPGDDERGNIAHTVLALCRCNFDCLAQSKWQSARTIAGFLGGCELNAVLVAFKLSASLVFLDSLLIFMLSPI